MRLIMCVLLVAFLTTAFATLPERPAGGQGRVRPLQTKPNSLPAHIQLLLLDTADKPPRRVPLAELQGDQSFYALRNYQPAWSAGLEIGTIGRAALALLTRAEDFGLQPRRYQASALQALADSLALPSPPARHVAQQARFEVLLTDGVLRFARHLRRGQLYAFTPSPLEQPEAPFEPAAWVARALMAPDFATALLRCQPQHREYQQLQQALANWRQQPAGPDPVAHRRQEQQMALTLERWRWVAIPDSDYIVVNLPAYRLEVVRRGRVVYTHRLLIGRASTPTPTFSSRLASFTVAPEWRVPRSVAVQQILPYLQENAKFPSEHDFLADNNYALYDAQGRELDPSTINWLQVTEQNFTYAIRQKPGCGNLLGNIVFRFANPYGLYISDTSEPKDFERTYRALAEGCMHVERPMRLAAYLLGPDSTRAALPKDGECEANPRSRTFYLKRPLPLHVRYATCAVVGGKPRFYADVYGRDALLRRQLFGTRAATIL
ncbi:L,D-transpeptidase family protein [Hymenobacter sp. BT491]|uniref:L,D-transpeptidase family protein n=1 Tax=Hymenobacter sp. BT491 TaxID=2766779 RepID=UPI0016537AAF|nr:L,D-transpeptidase family protein [Hymenobacter sp. BT491]MBC6990551.1 L,D-transpeptidase family protein [Hymenobacter sp. BT491]